MKLFILSVALMLSATLQAQQINKVTIQASGLTCSMCSNAINKALKTVDFVKDIKPDIQHSSFEITFKNGSHIDFERLKKKVEDAGFSVASFTATILFSKPSASTGSVNVDNKTLIFMNTTQAELSGERTLKVLNKGFVPPKVFKQTKVPQPAPGTYYVSI